VVVCEQGGGGYLSGLLAAMVEWQGEIVKPLKVCQSMHSIKVLPGNPSRYRSEALESTL
jgi:hypothetical protein